MKKIMFVVALTMCALPFISCNKGAKCDETADSVSVDTVVVDTVDTVVVDTVVVDTVVVDSVK